MKGQGYVESEAVAPSVSHGTRARVAAPAGRLRDDDELLKIPEVGVWLGCSGRQVYHLMRGDRPLPVRRVGTVLRVRVGDLRQWVRDAPQVGL